MANLQRYTVKGTWFTTGWQHQPSNHSLPHGKAELPLAINISVAATWIEHAGVKHALVQSKDPWGLLDDGYPTRPVPPVE